MGYALAPVLSLYTTDEIRAARLLALHEGYQWDCVGTDPRVTGKRFLRAAAIAARQSLKYPLHPRENAWSKDEQYPAKP